MIRCLLLLFALALTGSRCAPRVHEAGEALAARSADPRATSVRFGPLALLSVRQLRHGDRRFGGISGLWIDGNGKRLLAVSDRGHWLSARLELDRHGMLRALKDWRISPLLTPEGRPVSGAGADAEALTRDRGGSWLVAFEHDHRILRYPAGEPLRGKPETLPVSSVLRACPANAGVEALAALPGGRLLALSEGLFTRGGEAVRGWVIEGRRVTPIDYAVSRLFFPTDAAVLPTGDVLVLERRFLGINLAARLRVLPAEQLEPGNKLLRPRLVAQLDHPLPLDNLEGLATLEHPEGLIVFIVSDDNFSSLQRTLLYQFRYLP